MKETTEGLVCGTAWNIEFDMVVKDEFGYIPCSHCHGEHYRRRFPALRDNAEQIRAWYVPRVLSIAPDDPYHCAQICLDCLLEKLGQITVSQWIHITEALPEPGTDVLVCDPDGDVTLAEFWYNGEYYGWSDLTSDGVAGWELDQIEWWMPKPSPRKPT